MKNSKLFTLLAALICATTAWAQTSVSTDSELRAAIKNDGANITVTADINLSNSTLSIESGKTVTIDLGGHTLDRKLTKRGEGGGQVITVRQGATLNLSNGTLTGAWGRGGGGLVNENGTANLTNVIITGNVGEDRGGGIYNYGTLTMTGGEITNNISQDKTDPKGGGGLFNAKNCTATLTNVTISGNEAKHYGGGGICNFGTLSLNGVTIQNNKAGSHGGAIWEEGTLYMQGANTITGNKVGNRDDNLYLYKGKLIHVTGSIAGSTIGVGMAKVSTFTDGLATYDSGVEPSTIFTSDSKALRITSDNGEGHFAVDYIERAWDKEQKRVVETTKTLTRSVDYYAVPEEGDYKEVTAVNGWFQLGGFRNDSLPEYYVVCGNVNHTTMNVLGKNVHLILGDNTKLSLSGGILCYNTETNKPTLYIHSQSYEANMGELYISSGYKGAAAGIGSDWEKTVTENCSRPAGDLEIHGGKLNVTGGEDAAGIGGGSSQEAGKITIYGGEITARGGDDQTNAGAGIGGTNNGGGHLIIYDGIVHAYGGKGAPGIGTGNCVLNDLTATHYQFTAGHSGSDGPDWDYTYAVTIVEIYGGQIDAHGGGDAAGIGGGEKSNGVILTIYGGDVKAYGNDDAAGIGGGWGGDGGLTIIYGGTVYAKGSGNGAGIGSGSEMIDQGGRQGGTTDIRGGHVEAYGGVDAAGIGGGEDADGGTVKIFGGYVYAQGKDYGAGIGGGQDGDGADVTIIGGTVIAKAGCDETGMRAIGPGEGNDNYGSLKLGNDLMVTSERTFTAPERKNACWYRTQVRVEPCAHGGATASVLNGEKHDMTNCKWCYVTGEEPHAFGDDSRCDACGLIRLADEGDNSALFSKWADGNDHDFFLSGRKLIPNEEGSRAYTVCLPFDMDLTGRDDLMLYTLSYIKGGSEMVFTQTAKKIEAGKPYLIVIHQGELELLGNGKLITTASEGVRVYDWENREQPLGWWRGTLTKIESADAAEMMAYALQSVGDFRRIRPDTPQAWWGAFRSMYCPDELPATNRLTINKGTFSGFGGQTVTVTFEGDADIQDGTGIDEIKNVPPAPDRREENLKMKNDSWYNLSGQRLSKPQKGINIINGTKVVVK